MNTDDQKPDAKLLVTGWGSGNDLLKTEVKTVPLSQCSAEYLIYNKKTHDEATKNGISESQYCAIDENGRSDTCHGDSGGPIQIFHNPSTAHVVGIVSFGVGCGQMLPSIYTRVAHYLDWIAPRVWPVKR